MAPNIGSGYDASSGLFSQHAKTYTTIRLGGTDLRDRSADDRQSKKFVAIQLCSRIHTALVCSRLRWDTHSSDVCIEFGSSSARGIAGGDRRIRLSISSRYQ